MRFFLCLILIVIGILPGCQSLHMSTMNTSTRKTSFDIPEYLEPIRKTVLSEAIRFIGTPYCYGGKTPFCTDCSGFIVQVYRTVGIVTPRTAQEQFLSYASEDVIPEPGDLLFFRYSGNANVSHVGIYLGEDMMIHASEKRGVVISSLEYMRPFIVGYGRMPIHEFSSK